MPPGFAKPKRSGAAPFAGACCTPAGVAHRCLGFGRTIPGPANCSRLAGSPVSLVSLPKAAALLLLVASTHAFGTEAWVSAGRANVRLLPSASSPIIGLLEKGDRVDVLEGVSPEGGWTLLQPLGAVRSEFLLLGEPAANHPPVEFIYGRVIAASATVRAGPDVDARIVSHQARRHILAFKKSTDAEGAWLERPDGTFVARADVKLLEASALHGVFSPPPRLAFLLRQVWVRPPDDPTGPESLLERYDAVRVESVGRSVRTARGLIPRGAVRLAQAVARPTGIGPATKWIHVDTAEQVLTAYEGDRMVFATLVSTGKPGWETPAGRFQVWLKLRHGEMRGHRASYLVEEVPYSLFFGGDTALHGVTWHDRFGTAVSHGCVNLSPADAAWLFEWAPPVLPDGWHGILPGGAGLDSLWVIVAPPRARPWTALAPPLPQGVGE